ncbi:MAG: hypothetical protein WC815_03115 [Vicinamibacterales bacterium]|jgi:hypothetical protein
MPRDLIASIGTDRYLTADDLGSGAFSHDAAVTWKTYRTQFDGFAGACLDPQFARLTHPATHAGIPRVHPGTAVIIAGAGPSLEHVAPELAHARDRLSIWTSLRGAEALATYGLAPDLLLVQHQSDLDAYLSVRHLDDRNGATPANHAPVVLAEARTPAALIARVPSARLAAFNGACGWGLWPASLAWLAAAAGADAIALAGIDLGTADAPDPAHEALRALLGLLATTTTAVTVDAGGADKPGWARAPITPLTSATGARTVLLERAPWPEPEARIEALAAGLEYLREALDSATAFRALAIEARASRPRGQAEGRLADAWNVVLGWRHTPAMRAAFQEDLSVSFLPRFWRQAAPSVAGPLWRPLLLATDEIVRQADRARWCVSAPRKAMSA